MLARPWAGRSEQHKATAENQAELGSEMAPLWNEDGVYPTYVRAEDLGGWGEVRKRRWGDGGKGRQIGKDRDRERNTAGERGRNGHRDRNRSRDKEKQGDKRDRQRNRETDKESEMKKDTGRERQIRDEDTQGTDRGTGDRGGRHRKATGNL